MELVFTVQKVEYRVSPHYHCIDRHIYSEQKITSWSGNPVYNSQLPHVLERKISKENAATGSLSHKHTHTLINALVRIAATHTHTQYARALANTHTFTCQTAMNMSIWRQAKNYTKEITQMKSSYSHTCKTYIHKQSCHGLAYVYVNLCISTRVTVRCEMQKCNTFHGQTFCML